MHDVYLTIIPRARVGYEMIDSQRGYNLLISNKREWNNCFAKNNQEILLDLCLFRFARTTRRQFNSRDFSSMV